MVKKRREKMPYHKEGLGEQLENPETYGVRVSDVNEGCCVTCPPACIP
jgi:hypothetical protein